MSKEAVVGYVDRGCFAVENMKRCGQPREAKYKLLCTAHEHATPKHPLSHGSGRWGWCTESCKRFVVWPMERLGSTLLCWEHSEMAQQEFLGGDLEAVEQRYSTAISGGIFPVYAADWVKILKEPWNTPAHVSTPAASVPPPGAQIFTQGRCHSCLSKDERCSAIGLQTEGVSAPTCTAHGGKDAPVVVTAQVTEEVRQRRILKRVPTAKEVSLFAPCCGGMIIARHTREEITCDCGIKLIVRLYPTVDKKTHTVSVEEAEPRDLYALAGTEEA